MTKAVLQFCCIYRKGCHPLLGHKFRATDVVFFIRSPAVAQNSTATATSYPTSGKLISRRSIFIVGSVLRRCRPLSLRPRALSP